MNRLSSIYKGSIIYHIISILLSAYNQSLTKHSICFLSNVFKESKVINFLLEYDERPYYRSSLLYKGFTKIIDGINLIFKFLSEVFLKVASSSVIINFYSEVDQSFKSKPLKSAGFVLLGFIASYLFFNHELKDLTFGLVVLLAAFVLLISDTNLESLLKSSHLYRLLTYLLD